ncbi:MAG: alpha-glucan family phosphorylase [Desulfopila sp.]|jgi:starch phosphorylase|nr:alpha-glucan family phosphorylase [Desulfopila sp.]
MVYGSHPTENSNGLLSDYFFSNSIGTFFGIHRKVFDSVWNALTDKSGNSALYISMEIGADPDVYNPIKHHIRKINIPPDSNQDVLLHLKKLLHGPGKIPNYGGGLGVLAGDTLKSYADLHLPVVAVSLLYRHGYFFQYVDSKLGQLSRTVNWSPEETPGLFLLHSPENPTLPLEIEVPFYNEYDQSTLALAHVWLKVEASRNLDYFVPHLLLDFSIEGNTTIIQDTARQLYNASSPLTKALQRRLLGAGILPLTRALGITSNTIHLNEQHGIVVAMQLISEELLKMLQHNRIENATDTQIIKAAQKVAGRLVYTIHTPVKAGHDRFDKTLYAGISQKSCRRILDVLAADSECPSTYNFTNFAMRVNRTANSVSRLHRDVTRKQFPQFAGKISAITNGVHHLTWVSESRAGLFDSFEQLSQWRDNPGVFAQAEDLLDDPLFRTSLAEAWKMDTSSLISYVNAMLLEHRNTMTQTWITPPNYFSSIISKKHQLSAETFTIGFARRFSTYKRADLIFSDIDRLCAIALQNNWPVTLLFAGKAHPADEPGKFVIKQILDFQEQIHHKSKGLVNLIFIPNYDMALAKLLISGVHIWLNSPKRPLEASGTSGMKAAMNGVPNISIMDGWWVEGYHEGKTGWKFGKEDSIDTANLSESRDMLLYEEDSSSFYEILPEILDSFYNSYSSTFLDKSIYNLLLNIPVFNTHRMAAEYSARYALFLEEKSAKKMDSFAQLYSSDNFSIGIE